MSSKTPLTANQKLRAAQYGLTFQSAEDERYYRRTHPTSAYTNAVDNTFVAQFDSVIHPSQAQIDNYNRIISKNNSINAGGSNITQGQPANLNNPPLDQRDPEIVNNTGNSIMTPIGSGLGNPLNNLELNSVVAVVVGLFFVRGAFKLLTKIF